MRDELVTSAEKYANALSFPNDVPLFPGRKYKENYPYNNISSSVELIFYDSICQGVFFFHEKRIPLKFLR